jgi:IclR helix-turn-helix domain
MNPAGHEPAREQPQSTLRGTRSGVVHNAFAVLRALGRMHLPVGVTRLAEETGIPKTTVHRLLEQLADENMAVRVEGKWVLGSGAYELDRRFSDLASVAHPRLRSVTEATGASVFLYARSGHALSALSRFYGTRLGRVLSRYEQATAAEGADSAIWLALKTGRPAAENRVMHPDCRAIAVPVTLPSGGEAALALGLPATWDVEPLKAPLAGVAARLESDMLRLAS